MAKAWIDDRWVKDIITQNEEGETVRISPPASAMRRLSAARDPFVIEFPSEHKTSLYGKYSRWRVSWYEPQPDGTKKAKSQSFALKRDAEAKVAELSDDLLSGRYQTRDQKNKTFQDSANAWIASLHTAKPSTIGGYKQILKRYLIPRWGSVRLNAINEAAINTWIAELRAGTAVCDLAPDARHRQPSVAYVNQIYRRFHSVILYAYKHEWITSDPAKNITVPRKDPMRDVRNKVFLTENEIRMLADATAALPDANGGGKTGECAIYLMAYCGLRIGECFSLHVGDINLDARRITVRSTLSVDEDGNPMESSPKNSKTRKVAVPRFLIDMLRPFIDGRQPESYMFHTSTGNHLTATTWRKRVFNVAKEGAGLGDIEGLRPHALRHTFASLAISHGCDVVTLAAAMGHSDLKETLNTYAGLWPDRLDEVADAMEPSWAK
ncbi:site-specific integrase [uncultured Bifidobacterium sp.]|uniref:tyrosine-type recombinase/integrase n=1 Tax=uncultured Bifidobacterium sp. TaxID=165187 RepID=UPI00258DEA37|nr:site-specific integrase [uncultured Bifidobacterium sp.]